jgi:hypothetical protein
MNHDMNHLDPAFDPRIADWLEADPDRAPREVLDTILAAVPSIPQRRTYRSPRRLSAMNRFALLGAAAALVVAVGFGGLMLTSQRKAGTDLPTPSPAPSASIIPLTKSYSSGRGYTIHYPAGWTVLPAASTWLPGTQTLWGDPALDVIQSADARLVASSQALTEGQTPDAWYQAYCAGGEVVTDACRSYATRWAPIMIDSKSGFLDLDGVQASPGTIKPGGPIFDAVIVVDGRGYEFTLDGNVDRALFDQLLASVKFSAARTSHLDNATATFTSPLYGYSIRMDPSWTVKNATVLVDDPSSTDATAYDALKVTGTDTTVQGAAWALTGRTFDRFLADKHQEALDSTLPQECKGSDVSKWPEVPIGDKTGRQMTLCNYAEFYAEADGKAYTFLWGHDTFDTTQHLDMNDFKALLRSVTFPGA